MFKRLRKAVKLARAIAEMPERLAAIEERMKQLESQHTISIPYVQYVPKYPDYLTSPTITWQGCVDGKGCDYPNPWFGINPAPCKKCGIAPAPSYTVTCCENINSSN